MKQSHGKTARKLTNIGLGRSGQVFVEYLLIVIILVVLVFSLTSQFLKPFQAYSTNLMGEYTSCLLETGELPQLNNPDTAACPLPTYESGKAITNLDGSATSRGPDYNPSKANGSSSASSSSSSDSNGGRGPGGGRNSGRSTSNSHRASDGASAGEGKVTEVAVKGSDGNFFKGNANAYSVFSSERIRNSSIGMDSISERDRKKLEKKAKGNSRYIASFELPTKPKKTLVKPPAQKSALNLEDTEARFELGDWLRYIFIIAIILIIIALIGGQVAQMMESWEK